MQSSRLALAAAALVAVCPLQSLAAQGGTQNPPTDPPPQLPPAVDPQEPGERVDRTRVVVSATGIEEEDLETPYTFQRLSNEQFVQRAYRTLPEAMRDVPGVMVQKTAHGHGSPYIRGFTGRQNLVLIDGIRFNNSAFRGGPVQYWNTIDAFAIDRLELIKSQGSVLYGSDAAGGTINLFTKSSNFLDEREGELFSRGSAYYRFDTNGLSHTARIDASVGEGGHYGLHVGATYRDFGDIRDRVLGTMEQTGYEEFDYDLRFDYAVSDRATLTFAHQQVEQNDIWRTHRTVFFESWQGTSLSSPDDARIYDQRRTLTYGRFAVEGLDSWVDKVTATVSWQNQVENFNRTRPRSSNTQTQVQLDNTDVGTFGAALALESGIGDGTLVYGVDYYRDDVDSSTNTLNFDRNSGALLSQTMSVQGPIGDDATYDLFGAYAQYRFPVTTDLDLLAGGRFTYAAADIGSLDDGAGNAVSADKDWSEATFNVRANYAVSETWHAYGGVSQAFRAPNLDDLSSLRSSRSDLISTGSLDVEPERFLTYEVGARHEGEDTALQGSFYYTDLDGLVTNRPIGTVPGTGEVITTQTNGSDGYLWGFELSGAWRFHEEWTTSGYVAYVDGEADTFPTNSLTPVREPVSRLMPLTGSAALRWTPARSGFWAEGRVIAAARAGRLNSGDRSDTSRFPPAGTPSYIVAHLASGYTLNEHVEFQAAIENLTDTSYRNHGSGLNEAGFNLILGCTISW